MQKRVLQKESFTKIIVLQTAVLDAVHVSWVVGIFIQSKSSKDLVRQLAWFSNISCGSLGQAEQLYILSVDMYSWLYTTVQVSGSSLVSVKVSLTLLEKIRKDRWTNRKIHFGICRVAPVTKSITFFGVIIYKFFSSMLLKPDLSSAELVPQPLRWGR